MRLRRGVWVLVAWMVLVAPAGAQAVRVTLVDGKSGELIPSGLVGLIAVDGQRVTRGLTNLRGVIVLTAPPGRYTVRGDRIGYIGAVSGVITLRRGDTTTLRLRMPSELVVLPEVVVREGPMGCATDGLARPELEVLWREARKALESTVLTREQGASELLVVGVERTRTPDGRLMREREVSRRVTRGRPYHALSPAVLAERGFTTYDGVGVVFFAPDVDLLLSDSFIGTHCFGLVERKGRVGLSFSPVPAGEQTDIRGVMWVDRATRALAEVTFEYVRAPSPYDRTPASGFVRFGPSPGQGWIVTEWIISTPQVGLVEDRFADSRTSGEQRVLSILQRGGTAEPLSAKGLSAVGVVEGTVFDSLTMRPLVGVLVGLAGSDANDRTDSAGHYHLTLGVLGPVSLRFSHPRLTLLGLLPVIDTALVGPTLALDYATPSASVWLTRQCGEAIAEDAKRGVLVLRVLDTAGGPVVGATVSVTWTRFKPIRAGARVVLNSRGTSMDGETNGDGGVILCGVSVGATLTVRIADVPAGDPIIVEASNPVHIVDLLRPSN